MQVPTIPQTGKNAKVSLSFNDGTQATALALTKQASYNYNGESFAKDWKFLLTVGISSICFNVMF